MTNVSTDQLLSFFKVLADESRLKIVGLLAQQPRSVGELAMLVGLGAPTVSHHLGRLQKAGLVQAQAQQYYNVYSLNRVALQNIGAVLANAMKPETMMNTINATKDIDHDAFEKSVLEKAWQVGGGDRLSWPNGLMRIRIVLRWIGRNKFELGKRYTEQQVEHILEHAIVGPDTNHARRYMVDEKILDRKSDGSFYWRADTPTRQSANAVGLDPDALPLSDHALDEAFVARRKIQRTYFRGGRYTVPDTTDAAMLDAVLDVVWSLLRLRFEVDKPYTAEDSDAIIMRLCHGEPERIRKLLVEHKYLVYRKKTNVYLRTGESADNPDDLIAQYVKNDRLTALPDAPEQRTVVLRWLAGKFALRKRFDRNEVDAMIEAHKPANATVVEVRTALMKEELLDHKGTTFWRTL